MYVSVDIDVDDVIREIDTDDLINELKRRQKDPGLDYAPSIELTADQFRMHVIKGDLVAATETAREYLESVTGRFLN